jgi:3-oxoacyl-ACP reductase-like protein
MSDEAVKAAEASEETKEPKPAIAEAQQAPTGAPDTQARPTTAADNAPAESPAEPEDVHYQAVEKEGTVTALWEMQGQKHLRTIDPRSSEGKQILALFETAA